MKEGVVLSVKSYLKRHKTEKNNNDKNGRKKRHRRHHQQNDNNVNNRENNLKHIDQNLCKKWKNCKLIKINFIIIKTYLELI